jgi:hypothetical protein
MKIVPSEYAVKWMTPSCRAELEIGVGGDEDIAGRSEHPGEQVVQSVRESPAHNAEQLNLKIAIYLSCHILFLIPAGVSRHALLSAAARSATLVYSPLFYNIATNSVYTSSMVV